MLGKTAGGLFWMFRYLERAENIARLVEAGWRISLTRSSAASSEWQSIIATSDMEKEYLAKYDSYEAASVINFLLRDPENPGSVMAAIDAARRNGRLVRTALSSEVWEATNECWMDVKAILARPVTERGLYDALMVIRNRSSVVRGMLHGTMLRNDIFAFSRLGTFLERADNTARILDMKYYVLLPSANAVGSSIDNAQWEVILRSLSAERSYRWLYAGDTTARGIAEFLMLDPRMPRSLAYCYSQIGRNLDDLESEYNGRRPSHDLAQGICKRIKGSTIEAVFDGGLHEFLGEVLFGTASLAQQIETDFGFYA